jgi:hypothetical protein
MSGLELAAPEKNPPTLRFEGGEHTAIGDDILLRFVKDAPAIPARQVELHLPNGLALTYGQVIALGGDFYGIPPRPSACSASLPLSTRWPCCPLREKKHTRSWR